MVFVFVLSWFSSRLPSYQLWSFCKCAEGGIEKTPQLIVWLLETQCLLVQNIWTIHKFTWLPVLGFLCSNVFHLVYMGMCQSRGAYMGAPNLCFLVQKIRFGAPLFWDIPTWKSHVELLCMHVFFCIPQVPAIYHAGFHLEF